MSQVLTKFFFHVLTLVLNFLSRLDSRLGVNIGTGLGTGLVTQDLIWTCLVASIWRVRIWTELAYWKKIHWIINKFRRKGQWTKLVSECIWRHMREEVVKSYPRVILSLFLYSCGSWWLSKNTNVCEPLLFHIYFTGWLSFLTFSLLKEKVFDFFFYFSDEFSRSPT